MKHVMPAVVVGLLICAILISFSINDTFLMNKSINAKTPSVFVGVDIAYADEALIKNRIDQVSLFTNFVIIGCTNITYSPEKATEICQYAFDKKMYFMVYTMVPLQNQWITNKTSTWGEYFLGLYIWDEPGGKQLDMTGEALVRTAKNYSEVENRFCSVLSRGLIRAAHYNSTILPTSSSDYAFYWFDYKSGYDTMFAQFGWNYSREININLVRGAATVQNKSWGAIITWEYTHPPYIESGEKLLKDMKLAYDNGAKYIIVFDSNQNWTEGILQEEHIQALKEFWNYVKTNPRPDNQAAPRVAYVLPDDYAYGFRGPDDKIWGLFPPDNLTSSICVDLYNVMQIHNENLDIIYDDPAFPHYSEIYNTIFFWNGTMINK